MDINKVLEEEVAKIDLEEIIRVEINKNVQALIADQISNALRSYGNIGKSLSKHLEENLKLDVERIKLQEHSKFVTDCIIAQLTKAFASEEESIKKLINTKIFTETREAVPFNELQEELEELIMEELGINEEHLEYLSPTPFDISASDRDSSYSSSTEYKIIKVTVMDDSMETDFKAYTSNGRVYHMNGKLDYLTQFFSALKYRGTKIIF